jgi:hypothetical protein
VSEVEGGERGLITEGPAGGSLAGYETKRNDAKRKCCVGAVKGIRITSSEG